MLFAVSALVTAYTESELVWVFLLCGVTALTVKMMGRAPRPRAALSLAPLWLVTGLHGVAAPGLLLRVFTYFAEAGAFVFGSGLAIVPFLYGGVVGDFHWLTERQFLDAVAVAMITPGPVVITVGFIGYLVAGPIGATLAALGVFLPCYLFVVIPAAYFRRSVNEPAGQGVRRWRDGSRNRSDRGRGVCPRSTLPDRRPHRSHLPGDALHSHLREEGSRTARHHRRGPARARFEERRGVARASAMQPLAGSVVAPQPSLVATGRHPRDCGRAETYRNVGRGAKPEDGRAEPILTNTSGRVQEGLRVGIDLSA